MANILIFGKPGSGKSTVCKLLEKELNARVIATGDYLQRLSKETNTLLGRYVTSNWSLSGLREIGLEYAHNEYLESAKNQQRFIVIAPKTLDDAKEQDQQLRDCGLQLDVFLEIDVDSKECERRIAGRVLSTDGQIFSNADDVPEEIEIELRRDDKPEIAKGRIDKFLATANALRKHYSSQSHVTYIKVDATTKNPTEVLDAVLEELSKVTITPITTLPSDKPVSEVVHELTHLKPINGRKRAEVIQQILELTERFDETSRNNLRFPGSQPTILHTENVTELKQNKFQYKVVRKLDGERKLALVTNSRLYFLSRKLTVLEDTSLTVPEDWNKSVFDGEITELNDGRVCYFVFDCMVSKGRNICKSLLDDRLKSVNQFCVSVQKVANEKTLCVYRQEYHPIDFAHSLISIGSKTLKPGATHENPKITFNPTLQVEADGLIFIPAKLPYHFGFSRFVMKWKPPSLCTIDFAVVKKIDGDCKDYLELNGLKHSSNTYIPFGKIQPIPEEYKDIADYTIAECLQLPNKSWRIHKTRPDRNQPNADWVIKDYMSTEPVRIKDLLETCEIASQKNGRQNQSSHNSHNGRSKNYGRNHRSDDRNRHNSGRDEHDNRSSNAKVPGPAQNEEKSGKPRYVPPSRR